MKSFAVIALLVCFLGVLITTISSRGPFEPSDNEEDESELRTSEKALESDGVDQEDEVEEGEDIDDEHEVDYSER